MKITRAKKIDFAEPFKTVDPWLLEGLEAQ